MFSRNSRAVFGLDGLEAKLENWRPRLTLKISGALYFDKAMLCRNKFKQEKPARRLVFCTAWSYFSHTMKSRAVLQILLIFATLFGIAGYAFVHGPYAEPMTGS